MTTQAAAALPPINFVRPVADAPSYSVVNYSANVGHGRAWLTRWQAIPKGGGYSPTFDTRAEAVAWVEAGSRVAR